MNMTNSMKSAARFFTLLLLMPLALMATPDANAQDVKIGYTDQELIIAQMPEYRDILQQMQGLAQAGEA
jgi:Skp family chaperone for outer membrane proteins